MELLAALLSSCLELCSSYSSGSFFLTAHMKCHYTAQSSVRVEEFAMMEKVEGRRRHGVQSHTAGRDHLKQSDNRKNESAMRFILLAQGYDGFHLTVSVCISRE